ncbi:hypothetical protein BH09MYX1_BH09MYX1_47750 [soil metagenome]
MKKLIASLATEPAARAYLGGCLVDDLGLAVSLWATQLLQTDLMTDQHARAALAVPTLVAMLLGSLGSGFLADGRGKTAPGSRALVQRRFRVLAIGRLIETLVLAAVVVLIASGPVTIARILPFMIVSGFMKTALRPTRLAYAADVLHDERRFPVLSTWVAQARTFAVLGGLLVGGVLMRAASGRVYLLFGFDVVTNLVFLVGLAVATRRRLMLGPSIPSPNATTPSAGGTSAFRFLFRAPVLVAVIAGSWLLEMVAELYDGRMIVRHVLDASAETVRWMEIGTTVTSIAFVFAVPRLLRRVSAERLFAIALFVDAVAMIVAGRLATLHLVVPFIAILSADSGLGAVASVASDVVTVRDTPAHLRGRVQGIYQLVVLVSAMLAEGVATAAADAHGIPWLVSAAGVVQVVVAIALGAWLVTRARARLPKAASLSPASAVQS